MSETLSKELENDIEDVYVEEAVDDVNTNESSKLGERESSKTMDLVNILTRNSYGQQADDNISIKQNSANTAQTLEEIESILNPSNYNLFAYDKI